MDFFCALKLCLDINQWSHISQNKSFFPFPLFRFQTDEKLFSFFLKIFFSNSDFLKTVGNGPSHNLPVVDFTLRLQSFPLTWWRAIWVAGTINPSWPQHRPGNPGGTCLGVPATLPGHINSFSVRTPPVGCSRVLLLRLSSRPSLLRDATFGRLSRSQLLFSCDHSLVVSQTSGLLPSPEVRS